MLEAIAKVIGDLILPVGGIVSALWAIWTWRDNKLRERAQAERDAILHAENRRVEATRPFLERQLSLYVELSQTVATLASQDDRAVIGPATLRFWQLYWGELALVEDSRVEAAMVEFGDAIRKGATQIELQPLSYDLAHACRDSLARSWGTSAWMTPQDPLEVANGERGSVRLRRREGGVRIEGD